MALTQSKSGTGTGTSLTLTLTSGTTAGKALIVGIVVSGTSSNASVSTVTLGGSGTGWSQVASAGASSDAGISSFWVNSNIAGGQTSIVITITGGSGTQTIFAWADERDDIAQSSPFDKTAGAAAASGTSWSSGATATTAQAGEVWYGLACGVISGSTGPTITPPGAFTNHTSIGAVIGTFAGTMTTGYQSVSATGACTYNGTYSASAQSVALAVTFKKPVPGPSTGVLDIGSNKTSGTSIATSAGTSRAWAVGDLMVAHLAMDPTAGTVSFTSLGANFSSWTTAEDLANGSGTSGVRQVIAWSKCTTAHTAGYTVTATIPTTVCKVIRSYYVAGCDTTTPTRGSTSVTAASGSTPFPRPTATSGATFDALLIYFYGNEATTGTAFILQTFSGWTTGTVEGTTTGTTGGSSSSNEAVARQIFNKAAVLGGETTSSTGSGSPPTGLAVGSAVIFSSPTAEVSVATGDVDLKKMKVAGVSAEKTIGTGGPKLKKMRPSGTVVAAVLPTVRGRLAGNSGSSTTTTVSPSLTTGWTGAAPQAGDLVFLIGFWRISSAAATAQTAGNGTWTIDRAGDQNTGGGNTFVAHRIFDGTETTPTFTFAGAAATNAWAMIALTSSGPMNLDTVSTPTIGSVAANSFTVPAIAPAAGTVVTSLILGGAGAPNVNVNAITPGPPSPWTGTTSGADYSGWTGGASTRATLAFTHSRLAPLSGTVTPGSETLTCAQTVVANVYQVLLTDTEKSIASGDVDLKKMRLAGTGTGKAISAGGPKLEKMSVTASGVGKAVTTGGPKFKKMVLAGTSLEKTVATGGPKLKKMRLAGAGAGKSVSAGAVKLKKMSLAGTGTVTALEQTFASGGPTLKKMRLTGTSAEKTAGAVAVGLKKMRLASSGAGKTIGSAAVRTRKMKVAGTIVKKQILSGGVRLKKMRLAGSGAGKAIASGGSKLKKMILAGAGAGKTSVSAGPKLKKMKLSGTLIKKSVGSGAPRLKKMVLAGTSAAKTAASGGVKLKKMRLAGTAIKKSVGTGAVRLKKMRPAGTSTQKTSGSVAVRLKKMHVSGYNVEVAIFQGGVVLDKMKIAGTGIGKSASSGGPGCKKMRIAGTGAGKAVAAGGLRLKKMSVSGYNVQVAVFSGGVRLKKMRPAGISIEKTTVAGNIYLKKMRLAGTGPGLTVGTGGVIQVKMGVSGTGSISGGVPNFVSVDVHLHKMQIQGHDVEVPELAGASQLFIFSPL